MRKKIIAMRLAVFTSIAVACAAPALTNVYSQSVTRTEQRGASAAQTVVGTQQTNAAAPVRVSAEGTEAAEPSVAAGRDGTVYVVWVEHRAGKAADVWLSHRDAEGKALSPPVRVNPKAGEATAWRGDAPTVAVAGDGTVYVGWTAREGDKGHGNTLYLSASRDGGRGFGPPVKVHDDRKPGPHGMHSLAVAPDGRVHVAWLDERNVAPPPAKEGEAHQHMESNREVFYAFSSNGGRTFSANRLIAKEVCPCCKTSLAAGAGGRVHVSWRQVLPGDFRHVAVASSADGGQTFSAPVVVSDDRWMIAGCPVSGAALLAEPDGVLRVLWYTAGEAGPAGLYWSESRDGGRTFAARRALADTGWRGTPVLLRNDGGGFTAVWEGSDGTRTAPMSAGVGGNGVVVPASKLAAGGELPAAARAGGRVFVAYIAKGDTGRGIWLTRAGG